ncbi:head GIN domain-containing protein [Algoriphagus mannitolivorans]|uniref:head GIN domain-containing protein n=1 Tax=Algoriphagus mannitolivorans TaxID=226504 RepID=UPI0004064040|nr:head GIN domain-containing protein [Algoriphagus mannitolivorans]
MKTQLLVIALILLGIISCSPRNVDDSDNRFENVEEISGVARLKISGVINLTLIQSDNESISIEGSEELSERFKITQQGDQLELELKDVKGNFFKDKSLDVTLQIADLKELEFEGVGNIKTQSAFNVDQISIRGEGVGNINLELNANRIDADLDLMGNMNLKGKSDRFNLDNEGIGNIDASGLIAQNVDLRSSGIGRVAVHCEGELSLEVSGIGEVKYTGYPKVIKEDVSGIGKVSRN